MNNPYEEIEQATVEVNTVKRFTVFVMDNEMVHAYMTVSEFQGYMKRIEEALTNNHHHFITFLDDNSRLRVIRTDQFLSGMLGFTEEQEKAMHEKKVQENVARQRSQMALMGMQPGHGVNMHDIIGNGDPN